MFSNSRSIVLPHAIPERYISLLLFNFQTHPLCVGRVHHYERRVLVVCRVEAPVRGPQDRQPLERVHPAGRRQQQTGREFQLPGAVRH